MDLTKPSGIDQLLMDHPFLCTSGPLEFDRIRLCLVVCHRSVVAYFTIHTISSVDDYHPVSACDRESEPVWHVLASYSDGTRCELVSQWEGRLPRDYVRQPGPELRFAHSRVLCRTI